MERRLPLFVYTLKGSGGDRSWYRPGFVHLARNNALYAVA